MIKISRILYLILLIVYIPLSVILFTVSSAGFGSLTLFYYGLILGIGMLIFNIIFVATLFFRKIKKILINPFLIGPLVIFQIVAILFNSASASRDSICIYIFRYLGIGTSVGCVFESTDPGTFKLATILGIFGGLIFLIYLTVFLILIISIFQDTFSKQN